MIAHRGGKDSRRVTSIDARQDSLAHLDAEMSITFLVDELFVAKIDLLTMSFARAALFCAIKNMKLEVAQF